MRSSTKFLNGSGLIRITWSTVSKAALRSKMAGRVGHTSPIQRSVAVLLDNNRSSRVAPTKA